MQQMILSVFRRTNKLVHRNQWFEMCLKKQGGTTLHLYQPLQLTNVRSMQLWFPGIFLISILHGICISWRGAMVSGSSFQPLKFNSTSTNTSNKRKYHAKFNPEKFPGFNFCKVFAFVGGVQGYRGTASIHPPPTPLRQTPPTKASTMQNWIQGISLDPFVHGICVNWKC